MTYDEAVLEALVRHGLRELSDEAARTLCAAWQSPGTVGWTLAAVASGAWSPESLRNGTRVDGRGLDEIERGKVFRSDLWLTFKDEAIGENREMIVWSALGTWSMNGGDNDET